MYSHTWANLTFVLWSLIVSGCLSKGTLLLVSSSVRNSPSKSHLFLQEHQPQGSPLVSHCPSPHLQHTELLLQDFHGVLFYSCRATDIYHFLWEVSVGVKIFCSTSKPPLTLHTFRLWQFVTPAEQSAVWILTYLKIHVEIDRRIQALLISPNVIDFSLLHQIPFCLVVAWGSVLDLPLECLLFQLCTGRKGEENFTVSRQVWSQHTFIYPTC